MNPHNRHTHRRTAHALSGSGASQNTARHALRDTDPCALRHDRDERASGEAPVVDPRDVAEHREGDAEPTLALTAQQEARFHALYNEHFDFVLRNLKRLGVPPAALDDALQEVYLVVLRRLPNLQHESHLKAWLFAIIIRVAGNQRRSLRRRGTLEPLGERTIASAQPGPFDLTARAQAAQLLHDFLDTLDGNRRAVFVMAELEQLTAPEIARALGANLNSVYSWLRGARIAFSNSVERMQAQAVEEHG